MSTSRSPGLIRSQKPLSTPFAHLTPSSASEFQVMPPLVGSPKVPAVLMGEPRPSHMKLQQKDAATSNASYFGLVVDSASETVTSSGAHHLRTNWYPPTSGLRSAAASSPRVIPLESNPDLEAFRKRSEANTFTLGHGNLSQFSKSTSAATRLGRDIKRLSSEHLKAASTPKSIAGSMPRNAALTGTAIYTDDGHLSRSPKRTLPSPNITDRPRRNSPASFKDSTAPSSSDPTLAQHDDKHARLSLPGGRLTPPSAHKPQRADTLPAKPDAETLPMVTPQYIVDLMNACREDILLLDLRVSTQYAHSRISGALNLCIPTTLLKRPSFNIQKLAETFKDDAHRQKFERWSNSKYIVVYDANSSQLKDAGSCLNTLKKFEGGDWDGTPLIIRGGFAEFSKKFPKCVENADGAGSATARPNLILESDRPAVAPVVGGCPMPATQSAANPFFGNIRQNMDLIGGVGQIPITQPSSMTEKQASQLPAWLRQALDKHDKGKTISDKFLSIERREQKRMQEALSGNVSYGAPGTNTPRACQIAGVEKGAKNRYNNIWPYKHTRVKLQGVGKDGCDYINASYVKAAWSNKNYIATQAPIPSTFTDFWTVVWQQDVRVIVMLTAEKEGGQLKAHNYWTEGQYGPLRLNFLSEHKASLEPERIHHRHSQERPGMGRRRSTNPTSQKSAEQAVQMNSSEQPYVIVRRFTLAHEKQPFERMREITQLHYPGWPDFGTPAHPQHVLGLLEQCAAVVRSTRSGIHAEEPDPPDQRPVLVHCSAGCGRTGTFCTVDSVIDMLKRQKLGRGRSERHGSPMHVDAKAADGDSFFGEQIPEDHWVYRENQDLIEKTVEELRKQRISMVQTLRQFVLCYETVLEWMAQQPPSPKTA